MYVTGNVFGSVGELGAEPIKRDPELELIKNGVGTVKPI